ncbi:MAG TPA: deoxyribodipyrimidine photo-lyase [Phycisphaerae bacterium]|nr:deoxyribodipyrimidine photo-lyase [Phycisphaerae bacterium]
MSKTAVHWFRRDFRVRDNTGLLAAARECDALVGVFVVDPRWMRASAKKAGAFQVSFWLESLRELQGALAERNVPLVIRRNPDPVEAVLAVAREVGAEVVTFNKEYEPDQMVMDERLARAGEEMGVRVRGYKDSAIFEEDELMTGAGTPYSVYTPYRNAYLKKLEEGVIEVGGLVPKMSHSIPFSGLANASAGQAIPVASQTIPTLESLGYPAVTLDVRPGENAGATLLHDFCAGGKDGGILAYREMRDFPALTLKGKGRGGTSRLSAHLNAGTVSIRQVMTAAMGADKRGLAEEGIATFVGELIWREFYRMILFQFPRTVSQAFQRKYMGITWSNDPKLFEAWCEGRTGYPIVDAGMRQLRATGYMHNRLRMITAMFLTKDLDTHWVLGERYFMRSLMDYDQASNVGGWQWAASTGTDAAPYFRVMNPVLQSERFDAEGEFVRHFVPELRGVPVAFVHAPWEMPAEVQERSGCVIGRDYPGPVVDHAEAKVRAVGKFRRST